jgi:hypothetical protein
MERELSKQLEAVLIRAQMEERDLPLDDSLRRPRRAWGHLEGIKRGCDSRQR